jgi:DNA-binding transcriptional regulator YdaS (Cro superfamily)
LTTDSSIANIRTMTLQEYLNTTTQAAFAERLGVTQGLVSQWLTGETKLTAERAVQIEEVTAGEVSRSDLRPDLWPPRKLSAAGEINGCGDKVIA